MDGEAHHLFSSRGEWIGFVAGSNVFTPTGRWVGFFPGEHGVVADQSGRYVGEVVGGDRLIARKVPPRLARGARPAFPGHPALPARPERHAASGLPAGWVDVALGR
jgi:hypothetical protein